MIAVNARAWVKICQGAVRSMMRARRGNLVAVTSVVASRAGRGQSVYAGTKAFQEGFIRALAGEVGSKGVRVNGVAPGPIASGSLVPYLAESREEVLASSALGRTGAPEDVAEVVGFLCSDAAAYIHGQILHVDGGCQRGVG
jgi:3-oxoacyl-[acyl-carrier protein] reductase